MSFLFILALDRKISFDYFKALFLQYPDCFIGKNPDKILNEELEQDAKNFGQSIINKNSHKLWIACIEQTIVGFIYFDHHSTSISIDLLLVDKEYRRKGIGKQLVNQIFKIPTIDSCRVAILNKNHDARGFWTSLGFTLLDRKPG